MNKYKLVACDLDGTLLCDDLTLSSENKSAIKELSEKGVYFVPATGRALSEMQELVDNPDIRYIICSNGAVVFDKNGGNIFMTCMSKEVSSLVLDVLCGYDCYFVAHGGGETYAEIMSRDMREEYNVSYNVQELVDNYCNTEKGVVERLRLMDGVESYSVFFRSESDKNACKNELLKDERLYVVDSWGCNIEIFCAGAGKDVSLLKLCEILGIDTDEVITVGDSGNDIAMTKVAGLGLAVSNSGEALKKVADRVICSNNEHAVKFVCEHYFGM